MGGHTHERWFAYLAYTTVVVAFVSPQQTFIKRQAVEDMRIVFSMSVTHRISLLRAFGKHRDWNDIKRVIIYFMSFSNGIARKSISNSRLLHCATGL